MNPSKKKGFTLIEMVFVVIVLAILAAFTLPTFHTLQEGARMSAVKGALKQMRGGIATWHAKGVASGGSGRFPTLEELTSLAMPSGIPANPYNNSKVVVAGIKEGQNNSVGWIYNPETGEIYSAAAQTQGAGF